MNRATTQAENQLAADTVSALVSGPSYQVTLGDDRITIRQRAGDARVVVFVPHNLSGASYLARINCASLVLNISPTDAVAFAQAVNAAATAAMMLNAMATGPA